MISVRSDEADADELNNQCLAQSGSRSQKPSVVARAQQSDASDELLNRFSKVAGYVETWNKALAQL